MYILSIHYSLHVNEINVYWSLQHFTLSVLFLDRVTLLMPMLSCQSMLVTYLVEISADIDLRME